MFAGAFLLFTLEPLVGRLLLPRFGGAFHVWSTALMFFQGALLLAYLYAHVAAERLGRAHLLLIAAPMIALPPSVGDAASADAGVLAILGRLSLHVGLPFVMLATTAVVAQRWRARAGRPPWRLYAISNAGSLGALLLYPLVVEPFLGLTAQRWVWTGAYVVYVGLGAAAWFSIRPRDAEDDAPLPRGERPAWGTLAYWALLSAAPSALLLAVTQVIALEAGSVPLVWVVPLAIYLASFIVAFEDPKEGEASRVPRVVRRLWPHVAAVGVFFYSGGDAGGGWVDATIHLVVLGFVSLAAHGELYRTRPPAEQLTTFYVVVAAGGWAGGACVALVAPAAFDGLWEYPIALAVLGLTMVVARRRELSAWLGGGPKLALLATAALGVVIVIKVGLGASGGEPGSTLERRRSPYGVYRVTRRARDDGGVRDLVSGTTRHGRQREGDGTPLSYYHPRGPLGDAFDGLDPTRVGAVGLGVGAAAGHLSRTGQTLRFFEIDPAVVELARAHFSYLARGGGQVDVVIGDARVALEAERDEPPYDLLLVDAFSGDAIPEHLLTVEALELYRDRIADGGVILLHVSNRYYDLRPVLRANAERLGLAARHVARVEDLARDEDPSRYVALARDAAILDPLRRRGWRDLTEASAFAGASPWTDDHTTPLSALTW